MVKIGGGERRKREKREEEEERESTGHGDQQTCCSSSCRNGVGKTGSELFDYMWEGTKTQGMGERSCGRCD